MTSLTDDLLTSTADPSGSNDASFVAPTAPQPPEAISTSTGPSRPTVARVVRMRKTTAGTVRMTYRKGDLRVREVRSEIQRLLGE